MRLELAGIIEHPGSSLPFDYTIDLSDLEINFQKPFKKPLEVHGEVRNTAGVLELWAEVDGEMEFDCSRCAEHTVAPYSLDVETTLMRELANPDDFANVDMVLLDSDLSFELDEVIRDAAILESDMLFLCREDCKGVCPTCGKNLNDGPCNCKPETDPRFAALQDLLDEMKREEN